MQPRFIVSRTYTHRPEPREAFRIRRLVVARADLGLDGETDVSFYDDYREKGKLVEFATDSEARDRCNVLNRQFR